MAKTTDTATKGKKAKPRKPAKKPAKKKASGSSKGRQGLNAQQLKFCQNIAAGMNNVTSYKNAYKGAKNENACRSSATNLLANPNVKKRIAELRQQADAEGVLSRIEKRKFLAEVMRTPIGEVDTNSNLCQEHSLTQGENSTTERFKMPSKLEAIKIDNLMQGDNAPDQVEVKGTISVKPLTFTKKPTKLLKRNVPKPD